MRPFTFRPVAATLGAALLCAAGCWVATSVTSFPSAQAQTTPPAVPVPSTPAVPGQTFTAPNMPPMPTYTVQRSIDPIKIDGVLNEKTWQKAASTDTWPTVRGQDPGSFRTKAQVTWDDKTLYLAITVADTDVKASRTVHDSDVFNEDCVELFITEQNNKDILPSYLEYEINALGTRFDAYVLQPMRAVAGWDSKGWKSAIKINGTLNNSKDVDRGWVVEMSIPFFDMYGNPFIDEKLAEREYGPIGPKPGTRWRANFYRLKYTGTDTKYIGWSPPMRNRFHVPSRFGTFKFSATAAGEPILVDEPEPIEPVKDRRY